jgi:hypothetical protein
MELQFHPDSAWIISASGRLFKNKSVTMQGNMNVKNKTSHRKMRGVLRTVERLKPSTQPTSQVSRFLYCRLIYLFTYSLIYLLFCAL